MNCRLTLTLFLVEYVYTCSVNYLVWGFRLTCMYLFKEEKFKMFWFNFKPYERSIWKLKTLHSFFKIKFGLNRIKREVNYGIPCDSSFALYTITRKFLLVQPQKVYPLLQTTAFSLWSSWISSACVEPWFYFILRRVRHLKKVLHFKIMNYPERQNQPKALAFNGAGSNI